jgi:L-ascorbate metabolism protein UlaG (beta-lactamase superfamily)
MYLTWLDSNSWLLEIEHHHILIDPWLVDALMFGNAAWFFKAERAKPRPIPAKIDLILLSQGLEDHAHVPTLKILDRSIPVVGSIGAAKICKDLGYLSVTALEHGEEFSLAPDLKIQATLGSPTGPKSLENGYLISSPAGSLYYEPHGYHDRALQNHAPVDVVITPILDLALPLVGKIIKGQQTALEIANWLKPQVLIPTASGGDLVYSGLLLKLLQTQGNATEMQELLIKNFLTTQVIEPLPGDRFEIPLAISSLV